MKQCKKCKKTKENFLFPKNKTYTDGFTSSCKACTSFYRKQYYKNNRKNILTKQLEYQKNNREKRKKYLHLYRIKKHSKVFNQQKKWREKNKNKVHEYRRKYHAEHRDEILIKQKKYRKNNKNDIKKTLLAWKKRNPLYKNNYEKNKRIVDIQYKLSSYLRSRLYKAIKNNKKVGSAVQDLGCSIKELKIHLESQFKLNMTWDNYGKWHIDHIKPLSKFDLIKREELLKACNYTNLQPLWAEENLKKGNKDI